MSESQDLRQRLERLGVRLGTGGLRPPRPAEPRAFTPPPPRDTIEEWVSGRTVEGQAGACFLSESRYPLSHVHGRLPMGDLLAHRPAGLAVLADDAAAAGSFENLAFLDTETTGLAGGTGTYAFLVGVGTFEGGDFVVRQYFMRDIPEEPALLALVRQTLDRCDGLVTFNGRAFDWPLLETRFAMHRLAAPPAAEVHLDLLPPARRLWRRRLTSCALSSLEQQVLGLERSVDDVPGWAIPGLYRDFLQWGRAEPLRRVFYHNAHDILSLATLAAVLCAAVHDPLQGLSHGEDLYSLALQLEAGGDVEAAGRLYEQCLRCQLPTAMRHAAAHRLSQLWRRAGEVEQAVALWQALAERGDVEACVALAKHYEHRAKDLAQAQSMALRALELLSRAPAPDRRKLAELEHRLRRLEGKARRRGVQLAGEA